jgi:hypothetical protein
MTDAKLLQQFSIDELMQELRTREATAKSGIRTGSKTPLSGFDAKSIAQELRFQQKVIYGTDDRVDVFLLPPGRDRDDVDSVVALFKKENVVDGGDDTSTLRTEPFGLTFGLCESERFTRQPLGAFCSGFLVGPDLIATAGHCVKPETAMDICFVFGFRMRDNEVAETKISNSEIYRVKEIVGRQKVGNGPDWAIVRIDRPVANHRIAAIRRNGVVSGDQKLHVIGHPVGLPTKFAGGAVVRDNTPTTFFVANLDTYGGNSGSPVFNSETHEVEGILVRGEKDFVHAGNCRVSLVCPTTGCRGEDCTRTSEFAQLVPSTEPL